MEPFYFKILNKHKDQYFKKIEALITSFNLKNSAEITQLENEVLYCINFDSNEAMNEFITALNDAGIYFGLPND